VAQPCQFAAEVRTQAVFHLDVQATEPLPARSVKRLLRVHAVTQGVQNHLHVALRLHEAAHHAERPHRRAVTGQEAGDDGVVGPLARCQGVGVARVQVEVMAPVVQRHACARHHHAAAEAHVVALDQADHVALAVCRREVHRTPGAGGAGLGIEGRLADPVTQPGKVRRRQQPLDWNLGVPHVGHMGVRLGKGQLDRLDLHVQPRCRVPLVRQLQAVQHAQRHESGDALAVGRNLPDVVALIAGADRRDPLALVRGQVRGANQSACLFGVTSDLLGQLPLVEICAAARRDALQRGRVALAGPDGSGAGREACRGKDVEPFVQFRQVQAAVDTHRPRPVVGRHRAERVAALGIIDGRLEQFGERQPPEAPVQIGPAAHRSRHGHWQPAVGGHFAFRQRPQAQSSRGRAAGIQAVQLAVCPDEREIVSADAVCGWLQHRQGDGGGEGRVYGVAARLEDAQARLSG